MPSSAVSPSIGVVMTTLCSAISYWPNYWSHSYFRPRPQVQLMIERLAKQGALMRVDGGSPSTDLKRATAKVQAPELTAGELEFFAGLSKDELADRYFENGGRNKFKARYDKAVAIHGFKLPAGAGKAAYETTPQLEPLTLERYRSTPASEIARLYMQSPWWRSEVDRLIRERKI